ncbi:hypothetical protein KDRO_C04350 [Kluyveromyces lactis]|nr:hypothetical protein KDRO_C04350 [Kluyveromyces lactis]
MIKCINYHKRTFHTTYFQLAKGNVSWNMALDPAIPKDRSVKAFKTSLQHTIANNAWPSDSSRERRVLLELIAKFSIPHDTLKKQIKRLQLLVLQRRISDDDIHNAITKVNSNQIINVVTPKPINLQKELKNLEKTATFHEPRQRPKLQRPSHPTPSQHEVGVKSLHNNVVHPKKDTETETITDKDIEALKKFLERAETQEKQIKKFVLEQQRKYKWSSNQGPASRISSGSLLFQEHIPSVRLRKNSSVGSYLSKYEKYIHPFAPTEVREILLYDVTKSKEKIEPPESTILVHVQKKDLFAVVNGGRIAPDQLLAVINQYENEGWKLIGDVNRDTYNIVFQKNYMRPALIETKGKIAITLFGITLGYIAVGLPLIDYINYCNR